MSDELVIEPWAGRNGKEAVLRALTRSARVSLPQRRQDAPSAVPLQHETTGWATDHLLVKNAVPKQGLLQMQAKRDALVAENQRLQRNQLALRQALAHRQARLTAARAARQQLVSTITRLRHLIPRRQALEKRHQSLLSQVVTLESDLELLRVENNARRDDASHDSATMGIGMLFGGLLAGLLVTRMRR